MNAISIKSPIYQSVEKILLQKSPTLRFQQVKDRETKDISEPPPIHLSQPTIPEKTRTTSSAKSSSLSD